MSILGVTVYAEGVDYSRSRPSLNVLRAVLGPRPFAIRYISGDPTVINPKNISRDELAALHAAGFGVGLVWETTAGFMTRGSAQARTDAPRVRHWLTALGAPAGVRVYFALDVDPATAGALAGSTAYLQQMGVLIGASRVGAYGAQRAVDYWAARISTGRWWQTYAWSRGLLSSRAALYQYANGVTVIGGRALGGAVDRDRLLVPHDQAGLWWPAGIPPEEETVTPEEFLAVLKDAQVQAHLKAIVAPAVVQQLAAVNLNAGSDPTTAEPLFVALARLRGWSRADATSEAEQAEALAQVKVALDHVVGTSMTTEQVDALALALRATTENAAEIGAEKALAEATISITPNSGGGS